MCRQLKSILFNAFLVLKTPSLLKRGNIFWPIQRTYTEWVLESKRQKEPQLIQSLTGIGIAELQAIMAEINLEPRAQLQYALVRITQPQVVVETGVNRGLSSLAILSAMERNRKGELYSIDLPSETRLTDGTIYKNTAEIGKLVLPELRHRWHLRLGDARQELPKVIDALPEIDMFIHDSLHTEAHMQWEFQTAWPKIPNGGWLLSDDIGVAFLKFLKRQKSKRWGCSGAYSTKFGVILKEVKP